MPPILIDTNILVYASDPSDVTRQDKAIQILKSLEIKGIGRLSIQCLAEFMSVSIRPHRPLYTPDEAIMQIQHLMEAFPTFHLTPEIVLEAARGVRDYGLAYYDAQIWAAARLNLVFTIFSEDFSHGHTLEGVHFVNPFKEDFYFDDWV